VSWDEAIAAEPWRFDMFAAMRRFEALNPEKPRLGDSAARRDEYLDLGQAPHLRFCASNVARFTPAAADKRARLLVHFLGMLGPMGPLPLTTTAEALAWYEHHDEAFARFLDIFNNRFLQLFYRAFADARPAEQHARARDDRFAAYVGSALGVGGELWHNLDAMPDMEKLRFAGLLGARNVSATRIERVIAGSFGVRAEVEQFVGIALQLGADEVSRLGARHATLGGGALLGSRVLSVDHKFRLRIHADSLEVYERFLPGGRWCERLVDTLANAVGQEYDWDVELQIAEPLARPAKLGSYGQLGWTGWMRKPSRADARRILRARFSPNALSGAQRQREGARND
jgi:type VI secretion system protein ImpH